MQLLKLVFHKIVGVYLRYHLLGVYLRYHLLESQSYGLKNNFEEGIYMFLQWEKSSIVVLVAYE